MSIHRTEGVVLRSRKVRESSKIIVMFTLNYGKISTMAKGGLRPKSKFGSSLEIFTQALIIFYRKENRDLHTLSHSEILNSFDNLKKDVVKLAYASVVAEIVERLVPAEESNKSLYALLVSTLRAIDNADRSKLEVILASYELKMLHLIGYGPELAVCVKCGRRVDDRAWFGLLSGGVLCPACRDRDLNALEMSPEALVIFRQYQNEPMDKIVGQGSASPASREVSGILTSFIRGQIGEGASVKSLTFLERLRDTGYA